MPDRNEKYSTVGKPFEIDRAAIKIFEGWLPNNWLPRKQDPDFFVDYLVEIVENGEPTGLHFAAQVKGFEDTRDGQKSLKYPFATKHLKYYLQRSQHPVVLFFINVTTCEGYWFFAQKFLKEKVDRKILDHQDSFTIHFSTEDNLLNATKFKCLLPEAEHYVRDLHPGSVQAAVQRRIVELESIDPRCSVTISVKDGNEHVTVTPNEIFTFTTKFNKESEEAWQRLFERGEKVKMQRKDLEFIGAPLMQEALKNAGDEFEIDYGKETPGSIHIISKTEPGKIIPIEGLFRSGTKYLSFRGQFPNSPLSIAFESSWDAVFKAEPFSLSMSFRPKEWVGQPISSLPYFDQIASFANAFSGTPNPEMEIFIQGNSVQSGILNSEDGEIARAINFGLDWFRECRWLAKYFEINPLYPPFEKMGKKGMDVLAQLYNFLSQQGVAVSEPYIQFEFFAEKIASDSSIANSDEILRMEKPEQIFDFWGIPVRLRPIRHVFTEMKYVSQTPQSDGTVKIVLRGTKNTTRTTNLI